MPSALKQDWYILGKLSPGVGSEPGVCGEARWETEENLSSILGWVAPVRGSNFGKYPPHGYNAAFSSCP